jgi:hypothetical protein
MITVSDLNGKEDNYVWWLNIMHDEMARLCILPRKVREQLDFSLASLDVIEQYILDNYTLEEMKDKRNRFARDLFARYIGETIRKNMPERYWYFETENPQSPYYGIPLLMTLHAGGTPMTPTIWLMTMIEQKQGEFLRTQVDPAKAA